jgi:ferredoxin, 2Fe-2S
MYVLRTCPFFQISIFLIMPKITYKDNQGNSKTIEVENGLTVMEGAIQNDIPGIDADCGGSMACATCHVYVEETWLDKLPKAEEAEVDMIDMAYEPKKNSRLSCQLIISDELEGLTVTTPAQQS